MWRRLLISGIMFVLSAWAPACNKVNKATAINPDLKPQPSVRAPDFGQLDKQRFETFLPEFMKRTRFTDTGRRNEELDRRIREAGLNLAEKIESVKRVAPPAEQTGFHDEPRVERLILSVAPEDLSLFKFALEYDGDYKDLVEYIFHDVDDKIRRARIIEHLRRAPVDLGVKVLTDVDDTMYANLMERRYPKTTLYPGVLEFYDSLRREPFEAAPTPITTLSARPNPIAGILEQGSLKGLIDLTKGRLRPSALSGALFSSVRGTVQTVLREHQEQLDLLCDEIPHGQEDRIGRVKFSNYSNFSQVYPEYGFVFVGDSGQADALTAQLMITQTDQPSRVLTTFIHDIRRFEGDTASASNSFQGLLQNKALVVNETSASGRGVIVFRNYIQAAVVAHKHSATLEDLITADELATITRAALEQFQVLLTQTTDDSLGKLREEYWLDAESAYQLLISAGAQSPALSDIRRILDEKL